MTFCLKYTPMKPSPQWKWWTLLSPPKDSSWVFTLFPSATSLRQPLILFLSLYISLLFLEFYVSRIIQYILFWAPGFFTWHHYFEIPPCLCQWFALFFCCCLLGRNSIVQIYHILPFIHLFLNILPPTPCSGLNCVP